MAPKEEPKQHVTLGRVGTTLQMGIVGLPNVGKSTFFNVLTNSSVPAENFPFCTIDPSTSRVEVPDDRFNWLVEHWKPASAVPAVLNVTDIAGLVKGANNGEGLGNAFLSHIKAVDGIFHMVRVFEDAEVTHVEGNVDPIRDMEIITSELMLKDIQFLEVKKEALSKLVKSHKDKKPELDVVERCLHLLQEEKIEIRFAEWKALDIEILNTFQLLTAKPVVFLCNMTPDNYIKKKNKWLPKIKEWIDKKSGNSEVLIPFSAQFEQKIQAMNEEDRKKYLQETNTISTLPKIVHAGYNALQLIHYFTSGTDEVKCWTIKKGTKAPQAAGKIHTDFEKNFIMAEVMKFDDYKELGSELACKGAGKLLQKGREYVVDDGDILFFKFGKK